MQQKHKKFIPLFILLGIGVAFLVGWIVQLLWNATITPIFSVQPITYWQGIMLLILCKLLFSSNFNVHKEKHRKLHHPQPEFIKSHLEEKVDTAMKKNE